MSSKNNNKLNIPEARAAMDAHAIKVCTSGTRNQFFLIRRTLLD